MLRAIVADDDPDIPLFRDDKLNEVLRLPFKLGRIEGFALNDDETEIEPALAAANTAEYGMIVFQAAKRLVTPMTRRSIGTRALSASFGSPGDLIHDVLAEAYRLESGEMIGV